MKIIEIINESQGVAEAGPNAPYTPSPAKPFRNPRGFNKQGTGVGNKLAQQTRAELAKKKEQGVAEDTEPEGATVKNSLHTIIRVATHLEKQMGDSENFPEWESEMIGSVKDQMVKIMDYEISKKEQQGVAEGSLEEKWTQKYKSSINCSHPKGFSQKAHCAGKKKK